MTELLRAGLLDEQAVVVAGFARPAIAVTLAGLGAGVRLLDAEPADEDGAAQGAKALGPAAAVVADAGALFARGASGADELAALRSAADGTWITVRAVANAAWIEAEAPGGKVVVIAPRPSDGPHAGAARAALENLARTLSIEWARYGIRTTTITPGDATTDEEVASLVAYLVSPAGDYFSGARLDLGTV